MAYMATSWDDIARDLGFLDEGAMLKHLYTEQEFSLSEIATIAKSSSFTVKSRLEDLGVRLRKRGGAKNRLGKRKLAHLTDDELAEPTGFLVVRHNVDGSTVASERRYRQAQKLAQQAQQTEKGNSNELLPDRAS